MNPVEIASVPNEDLTNDPTTDPERDPSEADAWPRFPGRAVGSSQVTRTNRGQEDRA